MELYVLGGVVVVVVGFSIWAYYKIRKGAQAEVVAKGFKKSQKKTKAIDKATAKIRKKHQEKKNADTKKNSAGERVPWFKRKPWVRK